MRRERVTEGIRIDQSEGNMKGRVIVSIRIR